MWKNKMSSEEEWKTRSQWRIWERMVRWDDENMLTESLCLSLKTIPSTPVSTHRPWRQTLHTDWLLDVAEGRWGGGYEYVWTLTGWYTARRREGDDGGRTEEEMNGGGQEDILEEGEGGVGGWRVGGGEGGDVKSKWWTSRDEEGWSEKRWREGRRRVVSGGFRGH